MRCVCGHTALDHHAHTGYCHDCTCSYFQADYGSEGGPTNARYTPYSGVYRGPYNLDQETA